MKGWRRPTNRCALALQFCFSILAKEPMGIAESAGGAVTCCTNTHLDQMSRFDLNSSRTAFRDACLAARDTIVSSSCLSFFFSRRHDGAFRYPLQSARGFPSVLYHALLFALIWHHRRYVNDLLDVVGTGTATISSTMLSDMRSWWTTLLASRTSCYTSHTQPTFILVLEYTNMHCGVMWRNLVSNKIGRDVSRCHPTPPPKRKTFSPQSLSSPSTEKKWRILSKTPRGAACNLCTTLREMSRWFYLLLEPATHGYLFRKHSVYGEREETIFGDLLNPQFRQIAT